MSDSYLGIAEKVLLMTRQPMSARQMLEHAFIHKLMPPHLYGATQWKTLQARLSEDLRRFGRMSHFYRTAPGVYFLRDLILDRSLASDDRREFEARPRTLDLAPGRMLTVPKEVVARWPDGAIPFARVLTPLRHYGRFRTQAEINRSQSMTKIVFFVLVTKRDTVLTHRKGRFRTGIDTIDQPRTLGFEGLVRETDYDLLDSHSMGVVNASAREVSYTLGINARSARTPTLESLVNPLYVLKSPDFLARGLTHVVLQFHCPVFVEPTKRRLAINDLRWADLFHCYNDPLELDEVSRLVVSSRLLHTLPTEGPRERETSEFVQGHPPGGTASA